MSGQSKSKPTKQPVSRRFKAPKITKVPARRGWTTASQEALLTGAIPQYLANKLKGPFFENFYGIWDNKFPLSLDSPEEIKEGAPSAKRLEEEHNRIYRWFNNHTRPENQKSKQPLTFDAPKKEKVAKTISSAQAYSHLYYNDVIKPIAIAEWPAERARILKGREALSEEEKKDLTPLPPHPPIWFTNKLTAAKFRELSDPVALKKIEDYRHGMYKEEATEPSLDIGTDGDDAIVAEGQEAESPEEAEERIRQEGAVEYARVQDQVADVMENALEQIYEKSGYVGFAQLAGPDGKDGGKMKSLVIFGGKTAKGHDFGQLYNEKKWESNISGPVATFASRVHAHADRHKFILPGYEEKYIPLRTANTSVAGTPIMGTPLAPAVIPRPAEPLVNDNSAKASDIPAVQGAAAPVHPASAPAHKLPAPTTPTMSVQSAPVKPPRAAPITTVQAPVESSTIATAATPITSVSRKLSNIAEDVPLDDAALGDEEMQEMLDDPDAALDDEDDEEGSPKEIEGALPVVGVDSETPASSECVGSSFCPPTWHENGYTYTEEQISKIQAEGSGYEQDRVANIIRNDALLLAANLTKEVGDLFGKVPKLSTKRKKPIAEPESEPRRSARHLKSSSKPPSMASTPSGKQAQLLPPPSTKVSRATSEAVGGVEVVGDCKDSWPQWMLVAIPALESCATGARWQRTVETLIEFESLMGYPSGTAKANLISSHMRPELISDWIRSGRKFDVYPPEPEFIDQYGRDWWAWWKSLQPKWRADLPALDQTVPEGAEWPELMKAGANGYFMIMYSLTWWTTNAESLEDIDAATKAFQDVYFVLTQITNLARIRAAEGGEQSPKRARTNE